ncbi:bis-aminopropyl spermidine synthase family protein [Thermococcus argininiproducens]|uniref:N(4)-bis(aminopropyl)spermidine synthase n=1 Tax=Thermococcus argininiproducens TaxID=2866384 RepID=A0A9E7SD87_9EURY|nr:N(4)-bis(aminopropyl)spermidine synthase [Thermococcus argininiproducens]USH00566.1 bis-aminopropyl spermidine synthase family protein [Thermococcus argininiproducens]
MMDIVERVKEKTPIPVYERKIENVLSAILASNNPWRIVDLSEEPLPLVVAVVEALHELNYVEFREGIILTQKGKELVEKYGIGKREDYTCKHCEGKTVELDAFSELLEQFKEIVKERPEPKHEFDQAYVTPETTVSRIALMHTRGDLENKEVFVLGDDDLTSIALMLSGLPKRIAVLDIDERLTNFIEKTAEELGYDNVEIFTFDLRKPLPEYALRKFDTFITDPPETVDAVRAFVGRGIATLKGPGCAGYFGITRRESSTDKWHQIEKLLITEFNVVITDIIRNFNEYVNWGYVEETRAWKLLPIKVMPEYNWYKSYMFRIQTIEGSKGYEDEITAGQELYDDDESSTT